MMNKKMDLVFYDEVFEREAEHLLPEAIKQLPSAAEHKPSAFPKVRAIVPMSDKKYSIRYEFLLFRAPDSVHNNQWYPLSATRINTPEPPKGKKLDK